MNDLSQLAIVVAPERDNVAVAKTRIPAGTAVRWQGRTLTVRADVEPGHRFALVNVPTGEKVRQYGQPFAQSQGLAPGDPVNDETVINVPPQMDTDSLALQSLRLPPWDGPLPTFDGFHRPGGLVGTRNWVLVVPTSMCSSHEASQIALREVKVEKDWLFGKTKIKHRVQIGKERFDVTAEVWKEKAIMVLYPENRVGPHGQTKYAWKALEKFDFKKKVKFGTYAYFWVKRFILRAIMKEFEVLKVPEKIHEFKEKLDNLKREYELKYAREPTDAEIAKELKLPVEMVRKLKKYSEQVRVISSDFYNGEKEADLFEIIKFKEGEEANFWKILRNKDILEKIFENLKKKEKKAKIDKWLWVLKLHYGLENGVTYSYKEIAEKLGVSRQRVHQIIKMCVKKLQKEWEEMKNEKLIETDTRDS